MRSVIKTGLFSLLTTVMAAGLPTISHAQTDASAPETEDVDTANSEVAEGCQTKFEAPNAYLDMINQTGFSIDDYDAFCAWMNDNGLMLDIYGQSGTMQERAFASVQVELMRQASRTTSAAAERVVSMSDLATDDEANAIWLKAMNEAINYIAEDKAIHLTEIEAEEARLKAYWQAVE